MPTIFFLANIFALPFWLLMILLPHWRWTKRVAGSPWFVAPLALAYAALVLPQLPNLLGEFASPSLQGIAALLGTDLGATAGWIHFLAFDLFVGRWAYLDSRERGLSAWRVSPSLFLIFMSGPLGLLLYLIVRLPWEKLRQPA